MISVAKKELVSLLERCAKVAPQKSTSAYLSHVKLDFDDVLTYTVTNLSTSIRGSINGKGKPEKFTVNVRSLLAAAQSVIGDTVKLTMAKDSKLTVAGEGKRSFKVSTLSADDYPAIDEMATDWVDLPGEVIRTAIARVLFSAAADNDDRANLKCMRLRVLDGILSAATTNGRALAVASDAVESQATLTAIIPKSAIPSIMATEDEIIGINVTPEAVSFRCGGETLIARCTIGEFPPVDHMLDTVKPAKSAQVQAPAVIDSLAAIRRTDSKAVIDLTFSPGQLKIDSGSEDGDAFATDSVEIISSDSGHLSVAAEYLTGALKSCANATIYFDASDTDPLKITDGLFTAIIMPIRK